MLNLQLKTKIFDINVLTFLDLIQRCFAINVIYLICLSSTIAYLDALKSTVTASIFIPCPLLNTMDIQYVDILTGENLSSIQVANMDLIYWLVRSPSWRRGIVNWEERGGEGGVQLFQPAASMKIWKIIQVIINRLTLSVCILLQRLQHFGFCKLKIML